MRFTYRETAESIRLRMEQLLGKPVERKLPEALEAVVYRIGDQVVRISSERFADHDTAEEVSPNDAERAAENRMSFLLRTDDTIEPE